MIIIRSLESGSGVIQDKEKEQINEGYKLIRCIVSQRERIQRGEFQFQLGICETQETS